MPTRLRKIVTPGKLLRPGRPKLKPTEDLLKYPFGEVRGLWPTEVLTPPESVKGVCPTEVKKAKRCQVSFSTGVGVGADNGNLGKYSIPVSSALAHILPSAFAGSIFPSWFLAIWVASVHFVIVGMFLNFFPATVGWRWLR